MMGIGQSWKEILNNPEKKTMNLGWPHDRQISDEEIERVAVHEMGHSLGFIHEQSLLKQVLIGMRKKFMNIINELKVGVETISLQRTI